jgi:hypothetical protein
VNLPSQPVEEAIQLAPCGVLRQKGKPEVPFPLTTLHVQKSAGRGVYQCIFDDINGSESSAKFLAHMYVEAASNVRG